jgi:prepilin-type N-terminal cleavage/methylation domain-containing protein
MNKKIFTLLELLVAIAIIGILLSLLVPQLKQARRVAKTAVCMNQQKQIGFAFALYHEDNRGYYPVGKDENDDISWDDL